MTAQAGNLDFSALFAIDDKQPGESSRARRGDDQPQRGLKDLDFSGIFGVESGPLQPAGVDDQPPQPQLGAPEIDGAQLSAAGFGEAQPKPAETDQPQEGEAAQSAQEIAQAAQDPAHSYTAVYLTDSRKTCAFCNAGRYHVDTAKTMAFFPGVVWDKNRKRWEMTERLFSLWARVFAARVRVDDLQRKLEARGISYQAELEGVLDSMLAEWIDKTDDSPESVTADLEDLGRAAAKCLSKILARSGAAAD